MELPPCLPSSWGPLLPHGQDRRCSSPRCWKRFGRYGAFSNFHTLTFLHISPFPLEAISLLLSLHLVLSSSRNANWLSLLLSFPSSYHSASSESSACKPDRSGLVEPRRRSRGWWMRRRRGRRRGSRRIS